MLYLFCYVLRVKSFVRRGGAGGGGKRKDDEDDGFDVDEFIRRMTLATGLDVKEVQCSGDAGEGNKNCRISLAAPMGNKRCVTKIF